MTKLTILSLLLFAVLFVGCTTVREDVKADSTLLSPSSSSNALNDYMGLKRKVAIARFSNEADYAKGAFYDKNNDPIGKQAVDILSTKLASTGKFILLERADAERIQREIETYGGTSQNVKADYLIIGSITEFGRKTTGETSLFSRTKRQTVEATVSIRIVEVSTGQVIYSEEGKGEAETEASTVLGIGGQAGYDATLSDKALSAAISKLVENVVNNCMDRPWKSYFISTDPSSLIMAGGPEQGIKNGDVFAIYENSKMVKNPQTGMLIEIPGKKIGSLQVIDTQTASTSDGYSFVQIIDGSIADKTAEDLVIKER